MVFWYPSVYEMYMLPHPCFLTNSRRRGKAKTWLNDSCHWAPGGVGASWWVASLWPPHSAGAEQPLVRGGQSSGQCLVGSSYSRVSHGTQPPASCKSESESKDQCLHTTKKIY